MAPEICRAPDTITPQTVGGAGLGPPLREKEAQRHPVAVVEIFPFVDMAAVLEEAELTSGDAGVQFLRDGHGL